MMKFSRAISRVKWLSGEKNNVSKSVSVLVLRVLVWLWLGRNFLSILYLARSVYGTGGWESSVAALPGSVSCLNDNFVDEVFSGYQPGKVVQFVRDRRFEDHLCPRPQSCRIALVRWKIQSFYL